MIFLNKKYAQMLPLSLIFLSTSVVKVHYMYLRASAALNDVSSHVHTSAWSGFLFSSPFFEFRPSLYNIILLEKLMAPLHFLF